MQHKSKAIWMSLDPELICALYSLVIREAIFHNTPRDVPLYLRDNLAQCSFGKITVLIALQPLNNRPYQGSPYKGRRNFPWTNITAAWGCRAGSEIVYELMTSG